MFEPLSSLTFHDTHFSFVLLSPQFSFWTSFWRCTAGLSSGSSSLTYVSHVHVLRNSCLLLSSFLLSRYFPFTACTVEFLTHLCLQMAANLVPPVVIPRLSSAEPTTYGCYKGILGSQSVSWVHLLSSSSLYPISLTITTNSTGPKLNTWVSAFEFCSFNFLLNGLRTKPSSHMFLEVLLISHGIPNCFSFFDFACSSSPFSRLRSSSTVCACVPCFMVLHFMMLCRCCVLYRWKVCEPCLKHVYLYPFNSNICSLCVSGSHLDNSHNILNFLLLYLLWWSVIGDYDSLKSQLIPRIY